MPAPNCCLLFYLFLLLSDIIQNSINSMHGSYHMWVGGGAEGVCNSQQTDHKPHSGAPRPPH